MNHVRIRPIALAAATALAALALTASSASALPEFGQCFKHPTHEGKYTNSVCTAKAKKVSEKFTGEFEFRKTTEIDAAKRKTRRHGWQSDPRRPIPAVRAKPVRAGTEMPRR